MQGIRAGDHRPQLEELKDRWVELHARSEEARGVLGSLSGQLSYLAVTLIGELESAQHEIEALRATVRSLERALDPDAAPLPVRLHPDPPPRPAAEAEALGEALARANRAEAAQDQLAERASFAEADAERLRALLEFMLDRAHHLNPLRRSARDRGIYLGEWTEWAELDRAVAAAQRALHVVPPAPDGLPDASRTLILRPPAQPPRRAPLLENGAARQPVHPGAEPDP